jgi:hypothetical protein
MLKKLRIFIASWSIKNVHNLPLTGRYLEFHIGHAGRQVSLLQTQVSATLTQEGIKIWQTGTVLPWLLYTCHG